MVTRADLVHALEEITLPDAKRSRITFAIYNQVWKREERAASALKEYEAQFQGTEKEMRALKMKVVFLQKVQQEFPSMDRAMRLRMLYGCTRLLVGSDTIGLSQLQIYLQLYKQDPTQKIEQFALFWFIGFLGNPDRDNLQEIAALVLELSRISLPLKEILLLLERAVLEGRSRYGSALFAEILSQPSVPLLDVVLLMRGSKIVAAAVASLLGEDPTPAYFRAALALQDNDFCWSECALAPDHFFSLLFQMDLKSLPEIAMDGCLLALKNRRLLKKTELAGSLTPQELEFIKKWLAHFDWTQGEFPHEALSSLLEFANFVEFWPYIEHYVGLSLLLGEVSQRDVFSFLFSLLRHYPKLALSQRDLSSLMQAFRNFKHVNLERVTVCLHYLPREQFIETMDALPWSEPDDPLYTFFASPRADSFQTWLNLNLSDELEGEEFKNLCSFILLNELLEKGYYPTSHKPEEMIKLFDHLFETPLTKGLKTREEYMRARLVLQELTVTYIHLMKDNPASEVKDLVDKILSACRALNCLQTAHDMLKKLAGLQ